MRVSFSLLFSSLLLALAANASAQTVQDFDTPGTPFVGTTHIGFGPPPSVIGPDASSDGHFLRLKETPPTLNTVGFDRTDIGPHGSIVADFDFRITCGWGRSGWGCNDGFSIVFLDTGPPFGISGPAPQLDEVGRSSASPLINPTKSFAVGFDTFNNAGETNNAVWLTFNNTIITVTPISLATFDLATGINGVTGAFHHAHIELVLAGPTPNVTVTLTNAAGFSITPFSNFNLSGIVFGGVPLAPYEARLAYGARSGCCGGNAVDLDNISVQYFPVGPTTPSIDIRPDDDPNYINACSHGLLSVAILGSEDLDGETDIVAQTCKLDAKALAVRGQSKQLWSVEDVDGDGNDDLVLLFEIENLELQTGDDELTVTCDLAGGGSFVGSDSVNVVRGFDDCPSH